MLKPGTVVDRYTVEANLGENGWARVYRVRNNVLGGRYALKVISRAGPGLLQRLQREGRMQAALRHGGVIEVHDLIEVLGKPALVMDLVDGPDLTELLSRGALPLQVALRLFDEIAAAVGYAHSQGVIHGDLRPSNVLIAREDGEYHAKVGDFGLARALDDEDSEALPSIYIAPEAAADRRHADRRGDVWSLGVLLWDLMGGRPAAANHAALAEALASGDFCPEIHAALRAAITVDPTERLGEVGALVALVEGERPVAEPIEATLDQPLHTCPSCKSATWRDPCPQCLEHSLLGGKYRLEVLVDTEGAFQTWRALDPEGTPVIAHAVQREGATAEWEALASAVETLRKLDHPRIPRYYDSFEQAGAVWMVRELIPGASLAEEVEAHRFSVAQVLEVLEDTLELVSWLQAQSPPLVHRDIRPSNLVRGRDGSLHLVGFTRVYALGGGAGAAAAVGHLSFAAPEVLVGEVCHASDLYSVGAVGLALFSPSVFQGLEPAVDTSNLTAADGPLSALLRSMMRQNPEERPTASEALEAVKRMRAGDSAPRDPVAPFGPSSPKAGRKTGWLIGAVIAFSLGVLGMEWALSPGPTSPSPVPPPKEAPAAVPTPQSRWPKEISIRDIDPSEMQQAQITTAKNLLGVFLSYPLAKDCMKVYGREIQSIGFSRTPGGPLQLNLVPADTELSRCFLESHEQVDYSQLKMPVPFESQSPLP